LYTGLRQACDYFRDGPEHVLLDKTKAAVIERDGKAPNKPNAGRRRRCD